MPPSIPDVTIVGAGIVGIATASWLIRRGYAVTVIDRDEPGQGCSFGNAGGICPGSCVPLAMPGILKQVPGWLLDPEGPLFVRLAYLPRALPWLLRLLKAGDRANVEKIADALRALHGPTVERYRTLVAWAGCEELLVERGQLFLYESAAEFNKDGLGRGLRSSRGVTLEVLEKHALRQREPALAPFFEKAVYLPEQAQCLNPLRLVQSLAARFLADGGRIERGRIEALIANDGEITHLKTGAGPLAVNSVVLAVGAWSAELLKTIGIRVPLEAERGYHVTVADPGVMPRIQSTWSRRKFVATPQETGLRFAGTDEFAGLVAPPDERRAKILLRHGKLMVPDIKDDRHTTWMGHRPGTPDSLPVIGRDPRYSNLIHAFGHGHTGLMGASVTGHLVGEILAGETPSLDPAPYRIDRF